MYQPPATEAWLNVSDAAAFVQGMLPSTCRVVVAEAVLLPRRVRGLLPPTAAENLLSKEAAPQDDKGEAPVARLGNLGRQSRVFTKKRTRPIVKAREARKRRQVKALLPSDPPPRLVLTIRPTRLKPPITLHQRRVISMVACQPTPPQD